MKYIKLLLKDGDYRKTARYIINRNAIHTIINTIAIIILFILILCK